MLIRLLLLGLAVGLAACGPTPPQRVALDVAQAPGVIDQAVSSDDAVTLLTETTLRCADAGEVTGLVQTVCQVDNSAGSDKAAYFVTVLSDDEGNVHLIDAQVAALPETGAVEGFASFFRDTVVSRLIPELADDPEVARWLADHIEGSGDDLVGPVRMKLDRIGQTVRLQIATAS